MRCQYGKPAAIRNRLMLSDVILFIPFTCIYVSFHLISKLKKTLSLGVTVQKGRGDVKETRLLLLSRTVSEWIALFLAIQFLSHTVQVKSVSSTHYDLLIASYVKAHLLYFISHFICNQIFRMESFHWKHMPYCIVSASKDSRCLVSGKN